jgi:LysM repeat protein
MQRRKRLYIAIGAEVGGIILLMLLYLVFRIPASPLSVIQTPEALLTPTQLPNAPAAPTSVSAIQPTIAPTVAATPTIAAMRPYTVQDGDTLWGIAVDFRLSLDELVAANPTINPDRLYPGDVVNVPAPGTVDVSQITRHPTAEPAQIAAGLSAKVKMDTGGLRLRKGPGLDADVITKLPDATPLNLLARTGDSVWLEISLSDGTRGWVMSGYVDAIGSVASIVVAQSAQAPPIANATAAPPQSVPRDEPYLSAISAKVAAIYRAGQAKGNRANAFALVGDSNTQHPAFLQPLDQGNYNLGDYGYLEDTIKFFKGSFARSQSSPAAVGGFNTTKVLDPGNSPSWCNKGETPLACELRSTKASVALILLGTGDQHSWQGFEGRYRTIIEYTIAQGVIPVLITKGDSLESRDNNATPGYINAIIARLSREYDVPLLDLHLAIANLPNTGFNSDGFHYNSPPDNKSCYFLGDSMRYGYTIRNLTALQMLDAIRRQVLT